MHNIFSFTGGYAAGTVMGQDSTDINIDDNCFFGQTDVDQGAGAAFEETTGIFVVNTATTTTITSNSFKTLEKGVFFRNIDGSDNSVLAENCFAYNSIAVKTEEKSFFDEFGPNNLYNNHIDYQIKYSGISQLTTIFGSVTPNPPAPAPLCNVAKMSQKLLVPPTKPFGGYCPCVHLKLTEVPSMSPYASPNQNKGKKGNKKRKSNNS